jgi:hypothetical protein
MCRVEEAAINHINESLWESSACGGGVVAVRVVVV